jgi:iron complex transport system ATP-binding protein
VTEPEMLVLDEPMTGLDISMKGRFRAMFDILMTSGVCIVMVTHDLTDIPVGIDRIVMVKDGRIIADGPKEELLNDETVSDLYGEDIRVECDDGIYRMHIAGTVIG